MKRILTILLSLTGFAFAQQGIPVPSMSHCDQAMTQFMSNYDIPSATFAMAKDGKLVYMRAFGHADTAQTEPTQPYHMFRIASLSKPITSIAIMKLIEDGEMGLAEKVFGPVGIMKNNSYFNNANITDSRIENITIQHLLEHSAGWDRDVDCLPFPNPPYAWDINHCDPIGFPLHVTQALGESNPVSRRALIRFMLEKGLDFAPGTKYKYSNMGYLLLGLVIEEKTGMSYEAYVKQHVLDPIGACDMHIGKKLACRREARREYVGNGYTACRNTAVLVKTCPEYGGWSLEAMDAHGGWIATARDLVRLISQ
ncbi:MAG: serine hydrolase domain-containing protein [Bacteroidia bacterium]